MKKGFKDRLVEILLESNLMSSQQLEDALRVQKETGQRLSRILVERGFISERDLMISLSEHLRIPPIDLSKLKLVGELIEVIPKQVAFFYQVVPVSYIGSVLTLAMADPLNIFAMDDIRVMTGFEIIPVVSNNSDVENTLNTYYTPKTGIEDILKDVETPDMEIREAKEEEIDLERLIEQTGEAPVVKLVNVVLLQAIKNRASDIHIEPFEKVMKVRYRIDGVLYDQTPPPKHLQAAIVSRIKIMANLDIAERRLPQDGRFRIRIQRKEVDFRISILPTAFGEKVVLRVLDKSSLSMNLDHLGFDTRSLEIFREAICAPYGMSLITGPTGSGKTTTLYSALSEINKSDVNIITVEDPIEYQFLGINQVPVRGDIGLSFAAGLRSILRQDPDVIMVGEIRDLETADIAVKAALTGHLVFSTLHTNDAAGAISRLNDMGVEPFLISSSVLLTMAQRLIRKICPRCKERVNIPEPVLVRAQFDLSEIGDSTFYKGRGCPYCKNIGFYGRESIIELMPITSALKELIVKDANANQIKQLAVKEGMRTLRQMALDKFRTGVTALEEVLRVTMPD